ncbi:MAG: enoyl-CoA hydratase/isomerase family protein [Deltaproteobacteria bacterium]|nr:enoyl-CoA hydratase/isomerase family protein [Deltaproteobacteria bacterium]
MNTQDISIDRKGPVASIIICRPSAKNVLTPQVLSAMSQAIQALSREDTARVLIIRGQGEHMFSAGYDISRLSEDASSGTTDSPAVSPLEETLQRLTAFPYPTIAMLNGDAYGGGCELAISCDLRIAGDHIKMGMPPVRLGLVYPYPGFRRFMNVLGFATTLEVFLTGRTYDSRACLHKGLVNEVVEAGQLETFTRDLAESMAAHAPLAMKGTKQALYTLARAPVLPPEKEAQLQALFTQSLKSRDLEEARQAFREKRKPRFTGR